MHLRNLPEKPVTHWRAYPMPEPGWPAGYSALIEVYELAIPVPPRLAMVAKRYEPKAAPDWKVLPRRRKPENTLAAHMQLALKYEGVRLSVLNALFDTIPPDAVASWVRESPLSKYARRVWFLYEWLTGTTLDVPDTAGRPQAVNVVDPSMQVALPEGELSRRHRVYDNLPGTPAFCPMVWWTDELRRGVDAGLDRQAREVLGRTHPDVMTRAAAFLLLSDSKSSFEIEGEKPPQDRVKRWGQAIAEAGSAPLTIEALCRLQRIVIGDERFVELGLRKEGGFIGMRDRWTREPLPEHISARPGDLEELIGGVIDYSGRAGGEVDSVIVAAAAAFGFVYIHPFVDGNGRIHRWLIHHVLAEAGYNPAELPFPVSAAILRHLSDYRRVLKSYSKALLPFIQWESTDKGNVRVLNQTADYYRFFDATRHTEFLYRCVEETVAYDLPQEVAYLEGYDQFAERVQSVVDMPSGTVDLLHWFLHQNDGRLSKRAQTKEFAALTSEEVQQVEEIYEACMSEVTGDTHPTC